MKLRWKLATGLVALSAIGLLLLASSRNSAQRELEATRRSLRLEGFKIGLDEFDFSLPQDVARRAALLGTTTLEVLTNRPRPDLMMRNMPDLLVPAGPDCALVVWKLPQFIGRRGEDSWPEIRQMAETNRTRLEVARQAALSGPIQFAPIGSGKPYALVPYLADLKDLATAFQAQTVLALHDGDPEAAWTNLLAATCLVTDYQPEPMEVSHLARFACLRIAYTATWNALQFTGWSDARLADLQGRWERADFWSGLPETAGPVNSSG